jgi:hypothetical protein
MPRIVVAIGFLMSLAPLGCATVPGLANAPQLNGSQMVDPRVHDAIANGRDSCERRLGAGPLRNEEPACVVPTGSISKSPPVGLSEAPAAAVPVPWVKPYSDRGICPSWDNRMGRITIDEGFAFVPTVAETCTTPL